MTLSLDEVEHIAELARLKLTDEEKARYREQLAAILDYAASLQKIDTEAIPPTASVLPLTTVLRPDEAKASMPTAEALKNANEQDADMFRVRVVLEEEQP
jgi:aspartyl-tRNA(Asn)/glutamyl-tRNA(Gln) amidotransferase subunit C